MLGYRSGDTIVEVLLAITVFSVVAVGALTLMNQGVNTAQRSLEVTLVKQQIDAQAESLRAVHRAAEAANSSTSARQAWAGLAATAGANGVTTTDGCAVNRQGFVMNPHTATRVLRAPNLNMNSPASPPYAQVVFNTADRTVVDDAYGIWIETTRHSGAGGFRDAFDFRIRACWYGPGQSAPMTIDTNVRLYEP